MFSLLSWKTVFALIAVLLLYNIYLTIYRLYLSPLAKFPGPKLAAATLWHDFYFNVVKDGKLAFEIDEMHKKYGNFILASSVYRH